MRIAVTIDDGLIAKPAQLTGRSETGALVRLGIEALVARESARRLAALGGTDSDTTAAPRDRLAS